MRWSPLLILLCASVANAYDPYNPFSKAYYDRWQAESLNDIARSLRSDCYYEPVYYGPSDSQMRYFAKQQALYAAASKSMKDAKKERKRRMRANNRAKLRARAAALRRERGKR